MGQARTSPLLMKDYCRSFSLASREVQRDIDRAGPFFVPPCPVLRCLSPGFVAPHKLPYAYHDAMLV